jgi:hypothetical protein
LSGKISPETLTGTNLKYKALAKPGLFAFYERHVIDDAPRKVRPRKQSKKIIKIFF